MEKSSFIPFHTMPRVLMLLRNFCVTFYTVKFFKNFTHEKFKPTVAKVMVVTLTFKNAEVY